MLIQKEAGAPLGELTELGFLSSREGIDNSVISCDTEVPMEEVVGDVCNMDIGASDELFFRIKAALADLMLATL